MDKSVRQSADYVAVTGETTHEGEFGFGKEPQSPAIAQFLEDNGMQPGPDDRASLISSITNGPQVEMIAPGTPTSKESAKANMRDHTIRIGMIGNHGGGKTSLLRRFVKNE